jgi:hypothetical protein
LHEWFRGLPVRGYNRSCEKSNSPCSSTHRVRSPYAETRDSIRCRNFRSIDWYQKTYVQISWDYPFKRYSLTTFSALFLSTNYPYRPLFNIPKYFEPPLSEFADILYSNANVSSSLCHIARSQNFAKGFYCIKGFCYIAASSVYWSRRLLYDTVYMHGA